MNYALYNKTKGFTLVEMVVVVAIFGIITSTVIFNYSNFRTTVSLENLSQDIALTIRKTQAYSTSVKGVQVAGSGLQFPGYGIHFALPSGMLPPPPLGGDEKSFVIFADLPLMPNMPGINPSGQYEGGTGMSCGGENLTPQSECMELITITSADKINRICTTNNGNTTTCSHSSLDIVFTRPKAEPVFCVNGGSATCPTTAISKVGIEVESISGDTKTINIWNTGQINIE